MQTEKRNAQPFGKNSSQRTFSRRDFTRNKHSKTYEAGGGRPKNNFLKKVFRPIPAVRFSPLYNTDNYDCLLASAKNYAMLLGSHFDYVPRKNDLYGLYRYFQKNLPEGQHLSLIEENKKLFFKLFFGYDFLIGEVFFIPLGILNRIEGALRDIILTFFRYLQHSLHLPRKEDLFDYEMIVDLYEEGYYSDEDERETSDFLKAYRSGYINDTFSLIYQKPEQKIEALDKITNLYIPENEQEKLLIATIVQGSNILKENINILKYACRPENGDPNFYDFDDECIIEAERLIRFVYSSQDYVTENYLELLNNEIADSASEYFPRKSLILTPKTDDLLEVDYVERFFAWLKEFICELNDYEFNNRH